MEDNATNDERVMAVVSIALRQSSAQRESYLRLACKDDDNLYREAVELVKRQESLGSFMEHPLVHDDHRRPFEIGQVISNRFEIIQEIGEGGMGFVYEAFDRKRNQRIAIKAAKPGFYRLLSPELEGALHVRHRNVCLVNEIHTTQTAHGEIDFLTMELLEGETLAARLVASGALPGREAIDIASQLCSGLAAAHASGVIHRDLKPGNIMLCQTANEGLRVVIMDFGLAGAVSLDSLEGGTPGYMAPELSAGEKASCASDIYSLGVILYEIVTGRLPTEEKSSDPGRPKHIAAPSSFNKALNQRWDGVILSCLAASPPLRPSDPRKVIAVLEKRPLRKAPFVVAALLIVAALATPQVREWLSDRLWPQPNVRLAILPLDAQGNPGVTDGILQDVADRVGRMRSGRRTVVVIPPSEVLSNKVRSPEQAKEALHATHALQTSVSREGDELIANGAVIDLDTRAHVRDFSGSYTTDTVGSLPGALAGAVSLALRLRGPPSTDALSTAATVPYDRGLFLLRRDDESFDDAIPLFDQAARLDPRSPLPLAGLAEAKILKYQAKRDRAYLDEARNSLRDAESLSPDSVRVRLVAGQLNQVAGQYQKALEDYRRAQELEPRNVDALLHIASVYNALDMNNDVIAAYRKAIEMEPGYYRPYRKLGEFYYYRSNYSEAAAQWKLAIERAPGLADVYNELAAALIYLGQDDEAEKALLTSIRMRETADARNGLGAIRAYQKRDSEAADLYKRALALDPNVYVYWINLADSSRRLGRVREAAAAYRKAMGMALAELKDDPHSGYTRAYVGYCAARLGDTARADDEVSQAREQLPSDTEVTRQTVLTYVAMGQRDRAIEALNGASPELLHELDRHPDLADFRQDLRFRQVEAKYANGGK
jgi:eukaryotic-like serine/threonine-protein kinase